MRGLSKGMGVENDDNSTAQSLVTLLVASINALPETANEGAVAATFSIIGDDYVAPASFIITSDPSGFFEIVDDELLVKSGATFDYETTSSYAVIIEGSDGAPNTYSKTIHVPITNINEAPLDISLDATTILEDAEIGDVIAEISSSGDPDAGDTATYSIISDPDSKFLISGTQLRVNGVLDFATDASHNVTIRASDGGGLFYDELFVIDVTETTTLWKSTDLPDQLAGYDASRQDVGDGDLAAFTDYFGNGNHATQVSASAQPRIGDTTLNGLNVVTFDGSTSFLDLPSPVYQINNSGNNTLVVLVRPHTLAQDRARVISCGLYNGSRYYLQLHFGTWIFLARSANADGPTIPAVANEWAILTAIRDGTTESLSLNGATPITTSAASNSGAIVGLLGAFQGGFSGNESRFFDGDIAQEILLGTAANLSNIQKAEGRLAHKYGVQSILDAGHPYKTNPPTV